VVIDGGIQVRPIMKLTLSSDHRVIDGAVAAQFMGHLKTLLETADF
jgi:pyruvate dehydrogenase E2 component (dihydrolipoamide acetyltransferase)